MRRLAVWVKKGIADRSQLCRPCKASPRQMAASARRARAPDAWPLPRTERSPLLPGSQPGVDLRGQESRCATKGGTRRTPVSARRNASPHRLCCRGEVDSTKSAGRSCSRGASWDIPFSASITLSVTANAKSDGGRKRNKGGERVNAVTSEIFLSPWFNGPP